MASAGDHGGLFAVPLITQRLELRPIHRGDRDDLHRLEQDPEVMRHLNGGLPTPLEPIDPEASPYRMPRGGEGDVLAVVVREGGQLAGWVALHVDGSTGELGYRFFRAFWARGYATEASRCLITHAFGQLGLERVVARTMAANAPSRRVMEKLGMRHVATLTVVTSDPLPGVADGEVEYAVERERWRA